METMQRPGTGLPGLRGIRRKSLDLSQSELVRSSHLEATALPLVLEPAVEGVSLPAWSASNREFIEANLYQYGAILFRGFGLAAVSDFENVARSIYSSLYADYGDLPRASAGEAIYESTPYPADKWILFHNESSHLFEWPMKISFFCVVPAAEGGQTPIVDCRAMCAEMDPAVLETFAAKGLMYVRNFVRDLDVPWQEFFKTNNRAEVARRCAGAGMALEWVGEDGLRIMQRSEAVRTHPKTGARVFFNQVQLHHPFGLESAERQAMLDLFGADGLPRNVVYGDGSPIEDAVMDHVGQLYHKLAVGFRWQQGDMVMLDNMLVAHSRAPFGGARKIVVAMGDMIRAEAV